MSISDSSSDNEAPLSADVRVVQLTAPGRFGGLETVVRQLSAGLARTSRDVSVCCLLDETEDPRSHPFLDSLRDEGVPVEAVQLPHRAYLREAAVVARHLESTDADVLHTHGYHADVVGALAARRAAVPRIATAHGFTGGGWRNRFYECLQRRSYRSAAGIVAVSRPLAERLARDRRIAPKVRLLETGWVRRGDRLERDAARAALELDSDAFVVGWVGRMSHEKGPDVVVEALRDPDSAGVVLCMVGDGPLRETLRDGEWAGRGARELWPGAVADAGRLFEAFDVLVLSSRTEGTPMVLLEAMDAEVPIVAAAVGGVPDVVGPEEAVLVNPEDPAGLRGAVLAVLADPAGARQRAARAGLRLEAKYSPEAWLEAHVALYRAAVAAPDGAE